MALSLCVETPNPVACKSNSMCVGWGGGGGGGLSCVHERGMASCAALVHPQVRPLVREIQGLFEQWPELMKPGW